MTVRDPDGRVWRLQAPQETERSDRHRSAARQHRGAHRPLAGPARRGRRAAARARRPDRSAARRARRRLAPAARHGPGSPRRASARRSWPGPGSSRTWSPSRPTTASPSTSSSVPAWTPSPSAGPSSPRGSGSSRSTSRDPGVEAAAPGGARLRRPRLATVRAGRLRDRRPGGTGCWPPASTRTTGGRGVPRRIDVPHQGGDGGDTAPEPRSGAGFHARDDVPAAAGARRDPTSRPYISATDAAAAHRARRSSASTRRRRSLRWPATPASRRRVT